MIMRTALMTTLLALSLAACDEDLIKNPSFDRWCGDALCDWETVQGKVEQTSTWHKKDYAIDFVETPTEITQLVKSSGGYGCIRFDLIADVDPRAELKLLVDFGDNGENIITQLVPSVRWESTSFYIHEPSSYKSVRYTLLKSGEGKAVLAQLWAEQDSCSDNAIP